jgi:hypothetical protein
VAPDFCRIDRVSFTYWIMGPELGFQIKWHLPNSS